MSDQPLDRRTLLKTTGAAAGIGLLAGCSGGGGGGETDAEPDGSATPTGTTTATATDTATSGGGGDAPITIGAVEPLSGPFTPWGQVHSSGLAFGIDQINANGGVLGGRELTVVEADSQSDPAEASAIFERFSEQNDIVAATGPVSSDVGIRTSRTAQELGIPMLMHMAGSDRTITEDTLHSFRVGILPAATTMRAQAQLISDAGYSSVGAIVGDYAWGQSVRSGIEEHIDLDVDVQVAPVSASDFSSFIRRIPQDVEMVIATGHPPGTLTITQQLYELGYEPDVVTGPSFPPNVIRSALGEDANRGYTHIHMTDVYTDEFAEVATRYGETVGQQFNTHTAYGYITAQLIAQAIEDAGEADPEAVTEAIRAIEFDTLFAEPIQYSQYGELKDQRQLYSGLSLDAPSYYPDGNYSYEEVFRTDTLPALPADA